MNQQLLESLYSEYGEENVSITRRQLTVDNGRMPSYVELLAALCLKEGWQTPPAQVKTTLVEPTKEQAHNVFVDYAGFGGHLRLTCLTCGNTCLRQPYMNDRQWREKLEPFAEAHPCSVSGGQLEIAKNQEAEWHR